MKKQNGLLYALLLTAGTLAAETAQAQLPTYDIQDLGALDGGSSAAYGINNKGQVCGSSTLTDSLGNTRVHPVIFFKGSVQDLGSLVTKPTANDVGYANSINDNGDVVGDATADTGSKAFLYSNGVLQSLAHATERAINNKGERAGGTLPAYLYSNGVYIDIGTLPGGAFSEAYGINNLGQVVGSSATRSVAPANPSAFLYQKGVMQDIGKDTGLYFTEAHGITDNGYVAGGGEMVEDSIFTFRAFLWQNGHSQTLGTLGGKTSLAFAVNKYAVVVGESDVNYNLTDPFVWQNGRMRDLFAGSAWISGKATGINDSGQIVGYGYHNGITRAFLATPYYSVSGTVALDGVDDAGVLFSEAFTFTLTPKDGSKPLVQTQVLSAGGAFSLGHVPFGDYTLSVKGSKWLSASLPVSLTTWGVSGLKFALLGGDANGDNKVDIADFGVLVNAFDGDASVPDSGYNSRADFNCDGVVDIGDFGILVNNFNAQGAP